METIESFLGENYWNFLLFFAGVQGAFRGRRLVASRADLGPAWVRRSKVDPARSGPHLEDDPSVVGQVDAEKKKEDDDDDDDDERNEVKKKTNRLCCFVFLLLLSLMRGKRPH